MASHRVAGRKLSRYKDQRKALLRGLTSELIRHERITTTLAKAKETIDRDAAYGLAEAVRIVKENAKAKFDETIEVAINLGVDPRHADQMVRGVVALPNGTGKSLCVAVFAKGLCQ